MPFNDKLGFFFCFPISANGLVTRKLGLLVYFVMVDAVFCMLNTGFAWLTMCFVCLLYVRVLILLVVIHDALYTGF